MTREDALEIIFLSRDIKCGTNLENDNEFDGLYLWRKDLLKFVNKIYDDFESRTCENCHYYTGKVCYYHEGWNDEVGVVHPSMDKNDGCNRFSCKDKEK